MSSHKATKEIKNTSTIVLELSVYRVWGRVWGWGKSILLLHNRHPGFKYCTRYKMIVRLAQRFPNSISETSQKTKRVNQIKSLRWNMDKTLRKHAYSNIFKYIEIFTIKKIENFQIKISDILHISAQNIDCGYSLEPARRGGPNAYPQSMFKT